MLDVVFILLIFFIVTTSFVRDAGVDVKRPSAASAEATQGQNAIVAIRDNGEIWYERRSIDLRSVRPNMERFKAQSPEGAVILHADQNVKTGALVEVIDQIRLAGINNVAIAADTPKG